MTIKFARPLNLTRSEIELFENEWQVSLPAGFQRFLLQHNGAEPETNIFRINNKNESGINRLIPLAQFAKEQKHLDHINRYVFPIAWAEGGNYIIIDLNDSGSIHFWDHEEPEKSHYLGSDIDDFIAKVKPFDVSSVELKEGQVKTAWIDPDFLKEIQKKSNGPQ